MMNSLTSSGFLSSLLDNMDTLTTPSFSPFQISYNETKGQFSPLLSLPNNVLDSIVSYIPLKVRARVIARVCRSLRDSVYRSIDSVAFYKTQLDELSDTRIKYFLSIHGSKINAINFDLFRSVEDEACTQWSWRQSVITAVKMCNNLKELDILVCRRHRLRDTDLLTIFRECPQLQTLCIDAQYLSGHCFQSVPVGLSRLELEMCLRITDSSLNYIFTRLKKLKVLYVSELRILKDQMIHALVSNLKNLRDLSIIGDLNVPNLELSASALGHLARLPRLRNLCLEGLPGVTDRFLTELSDTTNSAAARSITSLSLAFCFNFSSMGLQRLARMPKLESLNLDGITKRDISSGLEKVAEEGRLMRLLLAEGTNVTCQTLGEILRKSPRLRLLDISNNQVLAEWASANALVIEWGASGRPPLTVLTDNHKPWGMVRSPVPCVPRTRPPVAVVHLHRSSVPDSEVIVGSVLSEDGPSQLPCGLLLPRLRRGNRYRLLCSLSMPSREDSDDQKENACSSFHSKSQVKVKGKSTIASTSVPKMPCSEPASAFAVQSATIPSSPPLGPSSVVNQVTGLAGYLSNIGPLEVQPMLTSDLCATSFHAQNFTEYGQTAPAGMSLESWMMWLTANRSLNSSMLTLTDPLSILTSGSAGAPCPPVEIPQQPRFHYTRGPRNKRRGHLQKQPSSRQTAVPPLLFNPSDFPPLQLNRHV